MSIIFGDNPEERIVGIHLDARSETPATIYKRTPADTIEARPATSIPLAFLTQPSVLGALQSTCTFEKLTGDLEYAYLARFESWSDYFAAVDIANAIDDLPYPVMHRIGRPAQQLLLASGRTLFKGMEFDDLRRMQLDIEVRSTKGFPDARRSGDEIIIVALSDNRGWSEVLDSRTDGESGLLSRMVSAIQERDPDVIEGHNIFRFDLPYIRSRCRRFGIHFAVGRDGSEPRSFTTSMRLAERSFEYTAVDIAGRHVVDTFLLLMSYDVAKRSLPGYGLKAAARHFGFARQDRTYVEGNEITEVWENDPDRLVAYAADDVFETRELARLLSGASFYLTQMTPMSYQDVARSGPGTKIESLMVREYLRERHSLPAPGPIGPVTGGYTDIFLTGVASPVVYADVESLYPSIMLRQAISPDSDKLGVFQRLLRHLTDLRLETKTLMATEPDHHVRQMLDAKQNSFKVLINSFYGYLGFSQALFNDSSEADRVTRAGREILRTAMSLIDDQGGHVIEVDTDGIFFVPPPGVSDEARERTFVSSLNASMPPGIRLTMDGRFLKMLSYKKKNYALLDYNDNLKFKGSSLVSRAIESFGRRFVRACVRHLFENDIQALHDRYLATREAVLEHRWDSPRDFSRTETIKDRLDTYQTELRSGSRQPAAAYEVALILRGRGQKIRRGDRVSYYVSRAPRGTPLFRSAKPVEDWRADQPDENSSYYLRRLDEFASKFEPFFQASHFRLIFSPEDMFGFSADGIEISQYVTRPESGA